jgi:mRNA-degrading endonuclease toxin of MazEF toxin-antitoxin module
MVSVGVLAVQITTADKKRLQDKIGSLSSKDMMAIEKAVKIH